MTIVKRCDWCGNTIEAHEACVELNTSVATAKWGEKANWCSGWVGHYHDQGCFERVHDAIRLVESLGPSLESIPTISNQALAARRRKLNHGGDGDAS